MSEADVKATVDREVLARELGHANTPEPAAGSKIAAAAVVQEDKSWMPTTQSAA